MTVWRRCNKCRSESDIAQNIDRCPACKAAWVGREFERAGDEGHDERLEPSDDVIAALQAEVVRQRKVAHWGNWRDKHLLEEGGTSKEALRAAGRAMRRYELLKLEGK